MLTYLLQGLTIGFASGAQPGPFQAYIISQTLSRGWRRTWIAAFAPLLSDGPIVLLVILVLTRTPDWSLQLLRVIGGLFLLYLAYGAYRSYRSAVTTTTRSNGLSCLIRARRSCGAPTSSSYAVS